MKDIEILLRCIFFYIIFFLLFISFIWDINNEDSYNLNYNKYKECEYKGNIITDSNFEEPMVIDIPVISNSSTKTYMSVNAIVDTTSDQWRYINESGNISIDDRGFLVTNDGYIGVALGSYFGEIGTKYKFYLDTGIVIKVCKVENKADIHTTNNGFCHLDGHVIEFVIDPNTDYMISNLYSNGYIFQGNFNNSNEFKGSIVKIEKILY